MFLYHNIYEAALYMSALFAIFPIAGYKLCESRDYICPVHIVSPEQ